jgi:hypothetical protein
MLRPPHLCVRGRPYPFKATELRHPANVDALRIVAEMFGANDNPLMWGGVA